MTNCTEAKLPETVGRVMEDEYCGFVPQRSGHRGGDLRGERTKWPEWKCPRSYFDPAPVQPRRTAQQRAALQPLRTRLCRRLYHADKLRPDRGAMTYRGYMASFAELQS